MSNSIISLELRYSGSSVKFKYVFSYMSDVITEVSLDISNYSISDHTRRRPIVLENSKYEIIFDDIETYNGYTSITVITKDNNISVELKVSDDMLEGVRENLLYNKRRNQNDRADFVSSTEYMYQNDNGSQNNNGFEHYNTNQVLNTGRPYNREVNERNEDPINTRNNNKKNNNKNNNPQGGYRKTRKRVKH